MKEFFVNILWKILMTFVDLWNTTWFTSTCMAKGWSRWTIRFCSPWYNLNRSFREFYNGDKHCLTWAGTAIASFPGMPFKSRMSDSWFRTDPENTVARKTFHIVHHSTLLHALISILLFEMYPWMEERNPITGGTAFRNNWRIRLGRYPVITWVTNFL